MIKNLKFCIMLIMFLFFPRYIFAEKIVLEGSTTVLPIAQKAAEIFMQKNKNVEIVVRGGGSGIGITSLIDGTCDIALSSRSIKESEMQKAMSRKVEPKAHIVALDGIAVIVHPSNPIKGLNKKQLKEIYTGKISDWSLLGGGKGKIVVISRDTSSGTFEAFRERALDNAKVRADALMQASNQAVSSVVAKTPQAIGYIGIAYISREVKAIEIEGVLPAKETVLLNKYPIARPLFMYTNGKPQGLVKDFLDFIKSPEGQKLVDEVGYVNLR